MNKIILSVLILSSIILSSKVGGKTFQGVKHCYRSATVKDIIGPDRVVLKNKYHTFRAKLIGVKIPHSWMIQKYIFNKKIPEIYKSDLEYKLLKAQDYLKNNLSVGDVVYYEEGFKKKDKYKNHLVYIYLPNLKMLNIEMIKAGYGIPVYSSDNAKYSKELIAAFKHSIQRKKGLWRLNQYFKVKDIKQFTWPSVIEAPLAEYDYKNKKSITVMTYNVENLFNLKHDPGKSDYVYLPLSLKKRQFMDVCKSMKRGRYECMKMDWNQSVLNMKLSRIASVIKSYKGGADILFFQEVENMDVLKILRDNHLQGLGYKTIVLIEGDDFRGIDVAVMSKLPLAERPVLHKIPFSKKKSTRGILQTTFHLPDKKKLYTLTLHFPSQASPVKFRMEAFRYLNDIKKKLPGNAMVIAAGDCNVTSDEDREYQIFDKVIQDNWLVSHRIGKMKYKGSTYFSRTESWSFFDIILFSKSLFSKTKDTWSVIPESIRISNSDNRQISSEDTPLRFKYPNFDGVSDHWPVVAEINLNQ